MSSTAVPAKREKVLTAGMLEMAPRRKAADSERAVRVMLGATSPRALLRQELRESSGFSLR